MKQPLLLDIATFLTDKGLAVGDGIDIFRDFIPEEPDSLVALMEYNGGPTHTIDPTVHRSVQVSVRDADPDVARQLAVDIFNSFVSTRDETCKMHFTSNRWGQVYLRQPPFKYRMDKNNRTYYGFNVGITTTIE